jgi:hypothetical protein
MDFLKIMRLPKVLFRISIFLARNLWQARKIPVIEKGIYDDVEFIPCTKDLVPYVSKLYAQFHEGLKLGLDKRILYRLAGEKLCLVVRDKKANQIVGYSLCYFNRRDIRKPLSMRGILVFIQITEERELVPRNGFMFCVILHAVLSLKVFRLA